MTKKTTGIRLETRPDWNIPERRIHAPWEKLPNFGLSSYAIGKPH